MTLSEAQAAFPVGSTVRLAGTNLSVTVTGHQAYVRASSAHYASVIIRIDDSIPFEVLPDQLISASEES